MRRNCLICGGRLHLPEMKAGKHRYCVAMDTLKWFIPHLREYAFNEMIGELLEVRQKHLASLPIKEDL